MVYSNDRSKAVVSVLVLLFVALWFVLPYEAICFKSCLVLFRSCIFQSFQHCDNSLGEERANLSAFRTFFSIGASLV